MAEVTYVVSARPPHSLLFHSGEDRVQRRRVAECDQSGWRGHGVHPDDVSRLERLYAALRPGEQAHLRYRVRKNRAWADVCDHVLHVPGENGAAGQIVGRYAAEQPPSDCCRGAHCRGDDILRAVSFIASHFLEAPSWDFGILSALGRLGCAAGVSRVYVFENHEDAKGRLATSQRFGWTDGRASSQLDNPDLQSVPLAAAGLSRWIQLLSKREAVCGPTASFPASEQPGLTAQGIQSLAIVPIFVGSEWWGQIGFDDCEQARKWAPAELDALKAAADIIGAAILRSRKEAQLRYGEALLGTVFACSPLALYVVDDRSDRILYFNRQFVRMWNLEHLEDQMRAGCLSDKELIAHLVPFSADLPRFVASCNPPQDNGIRGVVRDEIALVDGRTIRKHSTQIADSEDRYFGRLFVFEDISARVHVEQELRDAKEDLERRVAMRTAELDAANQALAAEVAERRTAQAALVRSELYSRSLIENIQDVIFVIDRDGLIEYASPSTEAVLKEHPENLLGRCAFDFIHPDDLAFCQRRLFEGLSQPGTHSPLEFRLRDGTGNWRWVEVVGNNQLHNRAVEGIVITTRDITERKEAEAALQASERRFRTIFDQAPIGVDLLDDRGRIVESNAALHRMLGFDAQELAGKCILDLLHTPDLDDLTPLLSELRQGQRGQIQHEHRCRRKDGSLIWGRVSLSVVRDGPEAGMTVAMVEDITERKLLEQQFRQAQKMEAVGQLAGGVAHDFNNLLTVINGYTELLTRRLHPEDAMRKKLDLVHTAGERAAALVGQLLAFSRRAQVKPRPVDVNHAIAQMQDMLRRVISEDIALVMKLTPRPLVVDIDPAQLDQVLLNLALNARDAMPAGGTLEINTREVRTGIPGAAAVRADSEVFVEVSVRDSGIGISSDVLPRIFEPFFTTKQVGKGTGLGLASVYGIVQQSGGSIRVESQAGAGATFFIYLPLRGEQDVVERPTAASRDQDRVSATILLVEDEETVRLITREILEEAGYSVVEACDAEQALRLLGGDAPAVSLVLTDIVMPRMNGLDLGVWLKQELPQIPVVFMSGYVGDRVPDSKTVLKKPFTSDDLLAVVNTALDGTAAQPNMGRNR